MPRKSEININEKVLITPTGQASDDFREMAKRRNMTGTVVSKTGLGVCQVLLPKGVSIPGYSQRLTCGPFKGREFVDLHESHLTPVL